jgi:hypothetical protein
MAMAITKQRLLLTSLPFIFAPCIIFTGARLFGRKENNATGKQWSRTHSKTKFARTQIKYLLSGSWNGLHTQRSRSPAGDRAAKAGAVSKHRLLLQKQPLSEPINILSAAECSVFSAGFASKLIIKYYDSPFSIWTRELWKLSFDQFRKMIGDWFYVYILF